MKNLKRLLASRMKPNILKKRKFLFKQVFKRRLKRCIYRAWREEMTPIGNLVRFLQIS